MREWQTRKNYLFDFDGTLGDSMEVVGNCFLRLLDEKKLRYPANIVNIVTPLGLEEAIEYIIEHLDCTDSREQLIRGAHQFMYRAYAEEIKLKEGVPAYLKQLKANGCSLNILSASPHLTLDACLKQNGIFEQFDRIFSVEDFGMLKSDVAIYHKALESMGAHVEDTVFFDDNAIAIETAVAAGLFTVGVYDKSSADSTQRIQATAQDYIRSFTELLPL